MSFATCCLLSYQRPQFLAMAVETLTTYAGHDLELIIHDDGSSDPEVHRLLEDYLVTGRVSTVIRNPPGHNQGQGVALNRMFGMAKGDVLIKLDQDLIFRPGWLARVYELLEKNSGRAGAEPPIGLLGLFHYHHEPVNSAACKIDQFDGWQSHTHICGSGFAIPRDVWDDMGLFEEHSEAFAEDWEMQRRITDSGLYVCALPDDDLVSNQGFGLGPSTVVVRGDRGEATVQKIHKQPHIIKERP